MTREASYRGGCYSQDKSISRLNFYFFGAPTSSSVFVGFRLTRFVSGLQQLSEVSSEDGK